MAIAYAPYPNAVPLPDPSNAPLPVAGPVADDPVVGMRFDHRLRFLVADGIQKEAERLSSLHVQNCDCMRVVGDLATAVKNRDAGPPPSLSAWTDNPTLATDLFERCKTAARAGSLKEQTAIVKELAGALVCCRGGNNLSRSYADSVIPYLTAIVTSSKPLKEATAAAKVGLSPAQRDNVDGLVRAQVHYSAGAMFGEQLKQVVANALWTSAIGDPLVVDRRQPDWYRKVRIEQVFEMAQERGSGAGPAGIPRSLPTSFVSESKATMHRWIGSATLGLAGTVLSLGGVGLDSVVPALGFIALGVAVKPSVFLKTQAFFSVFDLDKALWRHSKPMPSCGDVLRGVAAIFHTIRGSGNSLNGRSLAMLEALHDAMISLRRWDASPQRNEKGEVITKTNTPLPSEEWERCLNALTRADANLLSFPAKLVNAALPVVVSYPLWAPFVRGVFGP